MRRRSRSHRAALVAVAAYGVLVAAALTLVSSSLRGSEPAVEAPQRPTASTVVGLGEGGLALTTVGARAQRSTVGVGRGIGFVAWEQSGLTLVLTARPAGGWSMGPRREIDMRWGPRSWRGTLARTDPATGLGLVRVRGWVGRALWETRRPAAVRAGDRLVLVGRRSTHVAEVAGTSYRAIRLVTPADPSFAGGPVLSEAGRLVGVVSARGTVVPIGRACGVIRRC